MKTIICKKDKLTTIISNFGRGFAQTFNLSLTSESGEEVAGTYIEKRYFWIFPEAPIEGKLELQMQFHRKWINGIYSVAIKPDVDIVVKRK
jgi:hypothetical protein